MRRFGAPHRATILEVGLLRSIRGREVVLRRGVLRFAPLANPQQLYGVDAKEGGLHPSRWQQMPHTQSEAQEIVKGGAPPCSRG